MKAKPCPTRKEVAKIASTVAGKKDRKSIKHHQKARPPGGHGVGRGGMG